MTSLSKTATEILNSVRLKMPRNSRCVAMVHYHTDIDCRVVYRDPEVDIAARPELFEYQSMNYFEGPFVSIGDFVYVSVDVATSDGAQKAKSILKNGINMGKLGNFFACTWWMQDSQAAMVLEKQQHHGAKSYDRLGFKNFMSTATKGTTCSKRNKRTFSHHHVGMWFGHVTERKGDRITVTMESGKVFCFMVRGLSVDSCGRPLDDGINPMSMSLIQALTGKRYEIGTGFQLTVLEENGGKGFVEVVRDDELPEGVDGILIGPKAEIKATGDQFTIGFLQEVHGRDAVYSDLESIVHFRLWKHLERWADMQLKHYRAEMENLEGINRSIEQMLANSKSDQEWFETDYIPAKIFLAEKKYKLGLHAGLIPSSVHRIAKMVEKEIAEMCIWDPRKRMRVMIPEDVAFARYAVCDRTAIGKDGMYHEHAGSLRAGTAYVGGKIGRYVYDRMLQGKRTFIWVHRQPNGHPGERFRLELVWSAELEDTFARDSAFLHVSAETIGEMMAICGGGDQDDCFICYYSEELLAHFDALPAYTDRPVAEEKAPAKKAKPGDVDYFEFTFNKVVMSNLIDKKLNEKVSIGSVVLPLMVFNYLWHLGKSGNLHDFSHVGYKLDVIIDAIVKDGSSLGWALTELNLLYESLRGAKLPRWAKVKLSDKIWEKYEFQVEEDTELDAVLRYIETAAAKYIAFMDRYTYCVVLEKWDAMEFKPYQTMSSLMFDRRSSASNLADAIQSTYRQQLEICKIHMIGSKLDDPKGSLEAQKLALREGEVLPSHMFCTMELPKLKARADVKALWSDPEVIGLAYQMAERETYRTFHKNPEILEAFVVLWQRIYAGTKSESGLKVSDGLLWGRYTANLTIKALVWAQANQPAPVPLMTPQAKLLAPKPEAKDMEVKAEAFTPIKGEFINNIPNADVLLVVNGMFDKLMHNQIDPAAVRLWKMSLNDKIVDLVPAYYKGTKAYQVQIGGNMRGWIDAQQALSLWARTGGKQIEAIIRNLPGRYMMEAVIV